MDAPTPPNILEQDANSLVLMDTFLDNMVKHYEALGATVLVIADEIIVSWPEETK